MAMDQLGIIYGNTKIVDRNFFPGMSDLVMSQATSPPNPTAMAQLRRAIRIELKRGFQKVILE